MKNVLTRSALFLFILVFDFYPPEGLAQMPAINFETITSRDGLPSNTVLSATRDKKGFMWFGTRLCPVRYDGTTFQSFLDFETYFVTGIKADQDNNIWLSADLSGVCKIEAHSLKITPITKGRAVQAGDFYIDRKQNGWYSDREGVNRLNLKTNKRKHYTLAKSNYVWSKALFVEDLEGTLWVIGRDNGLFKYDAAKDKLIFMFGGDQEKIEGNTPILLSGGCIDYQGTLWLSSFNRGLIKYNTHNNTFETFNSGRVDFGIYTVEEGWDENGKHILWVGDKQGAGIFRPEQKKFYFFNNIFPGSFEVNSIYRDKVEGIVWICTSQGIAKYHPKSNLIQTITIPVDLVPLPVNVNIVMCDTNDASRNTYYLGLNHTGMLRWNRSTNEFSLIKYPTGNAETNWINQKGDGTIWIGTNRWDYKRPGIFVYDIKQEKFIEPPLSKLANTYFSVPFFMYGFFDKRKRLWIGNSDEGIKVLDEKLNKDVTPWSDSVQKALIKNNNLINDIMMDSRGRSIVGTYKGNYYANEEKGKFINMDSFDIKSLNINQTVNTLMEDHKGNIWSARWGDIVQTGQDLKVRTILTTAAGFFDRQNGGLKEDHSGNIWIGNYEGLYCFSPATNRLNRFTINEGLISNNTTNRIFKSLDGKELFIGQRNGLNVVKIDQLLAPSKAPILAISSFKIHEKAYTLDFSKEIELKRNDNAFSIDFIALNYRKQQDNQYAYYLEGLERGWNYSGSKHLAYYTNLAPGSYALHLKAGDALGNWNRKTLTLHIRILRAYYETWWFKTALVLILGGMLYGLYRYRINQIFKLENVRSRISADLHDQLGATLSGISIMGTLAKKNINQQHASLPFLERIVEEVQQMSSSLDDIVWNISPRNDALPHLLARMNRYASELFEAKQINYQINIPEGFEDIKLSMEQRRNFYMIFKESVNNLVKYAHCTTANIDIEITQKNLILSIQDNGRGFDPNKVSDRNGLYNMKSRSKALKGTLKIDSEPGKGTKIYLKFPMK